MWRIIGKIADALGWFAEALHERNIRTGKYEHVDNFRVKMEAQRAIKELEQESRG